MAQEKLYENKIKSYLESIGVYPFGTASQNITLHVPDSVKPSFSSPSSDA